MNPRQIWIALGLFLMVAVVADQISQHSPSSTRKNSERSEPCTSKVFDSIGLYESTEDQSVHNALGKKISLSLHKVPLSEALNRLGPLLDIEIVFDQMVLEEDGIIQDTPVSVDVKDFTAHSVLKLLLDPQGLDWFVQDGLLQITREFYLHHHVNVRIYDVADFVGYGADMMSAGIGFEPLLNAIYSTVTPDSWQAVGGEGEISKLQAEGMAVLVVRHSPYGHRDLERFLSKLRSMKHTIPKRRGSFK